MGQYLGRGNISFDQMRDGSVQVKTATYAAVYEDAWSLLVFNRTSSPSASITLTLPNPPPSPLWTINFFNLGSDPLKVDPNGLQINGGAGTLTATTGQGGTVYTDGTNYFSASGGASSSSGGGSSGGAITQIAKTQLGVAAANITFSGISAAFNMLLLTLVGRSSTAANFDTVTVQFNGDSGNNYGREFISAQGASLSSGSQTGVSSILSAIITAANATASFPGAVRFDIPGYKDATFTKSMLIYGGLQDGNMPVGLFPVYGTWNSTAAITSIVLALLSGANFVAGTTAILYGLN